MSAFSASAQRKLRRQDKKEAAFPRASPKRAKSAEKAAEVAAENVKKAAEAFVLLCQLSPLQHGES